LVNFQTYPLNSILKGFLMINTEAYDIVCIGNYTKDTIISPKGVQFVDGGAVNYAAHAAARLGYKVAVVTRLSREDVRVVEKFAVSGVDCFSTFTPQSTLMKLDYPTANPDVRHLTVAATAGAITIDEVEGIHAKAAVVGTSLRGEVNLDVIKTLRKKDFLVAADMQGFVRVLRGEELVYEPWEEMEITLSYLDILKSDAVEAEFLTGESDIHKAAHIFAQMGPKEIVLTHKDGLLVFAEGQFYEVGFYPQRLDGRSGRGDTCLGSYVASRLDKSPADACIWAAAVTSLKMEDLGPFNRSMGDVEMLIRERYNHRSVG
jgi:sugar/nucleoside kinase (ribokinase family)